MEREQLIQVVTRAQSGDSAAFGDLFDAFQNEVYRIALRETKKADIAADVVQETFIEVIQTIGKLEEPAAFASWLKTIAYHQCSRYYKKKENKHERLIEENEDAPTVFERMEEENEAFIPDKALDNKELQKIIRDIIDNLPDAQRAAVMMKYFEDMSVKEIAQIQGVSENTVLSRLYYARNAIKAAVEEYEKKHGIKLHAIPFLPLIRLAFNKEQDKAMPNKLAKKVAKKVSKSTGVTVSAGAGAAGLPLLVKILAIVAATAVVTTAGALVLPTIGAAIAAGIFGINAVTDGDLSNTINPWGDEESPEDQDVVENPIESGRLTVFTDYFKGKTVTNFYFNRAESTAGNFYVETDEGLYRICTDFGSFEKVENLSETYTNSIDWTCGENTEFGYRDNEHCFWAGEEDYHTYNGHVFYLYGANSSPTFYVLDTGGAVLRYGVGSSDFPLVFLPTKTFLGLKIPVGIHLRMQDMQIISCNNGTAYPQVLATAGGKQYLCTLNETSNFVTMTPVEDVFGGRVALLGNSTFVVADDTTHLYSLAGTSATAIPLPDDHTVNQLVAWGGGSNLLVFDNGDAYRWDADAGAYQKDEELSLIGEQVRFITCDKLGDNYYFLLENGIIYEMD